MTHSSEEALQQMRDLDQVIFIYYPILFKKDMEKIEIITLIDFENKINIINRTNAAKLSLQVQDQQLNKKYSFLISTCLDFFSQVIVLG